MKKRIVVASVLAVLLTASAYSQTKGLFGVVITGTPHDVQAAIDKGADVNAQNSAGETPLIAAAAFNKNPEVITTLLKAGADIEARDSVHGGTALLWAAAFSKNPEVVSTLLNAGADAKAKDNVGYTAFYYAKRNIKLKGTDALRQLEDASK